MIKVTVSTAIARRSSDVFTFIANFANNPRWQRRTLEAYYTTEPPVRIGSEYTQVVRLLGRAIKATFKVVDYEPGRLIKATRMTTVPITFTRLVEPTEDGCRVVAAVEIAPRGLLRLAEPLLSGRVRATIEKDYQKLKELLEK